MIVQKFILFINLKEYYQSITNFARKYKLTKDNFYILTGNLIAQNNEKYKFKNDSFDISDTNNNPLLVEPKIFMDADISKSNRVVSFEINFGDQGQGLFKSISLDQATYKNTTESAVAQ